MEVTCCYQCVDAQVIRQCAAAEYSIRNDSLLKKLGHLKLRRTRLRGETVYLPTICTTRASCRKGCCLGQRVAISTSLFPLFDEAGNLYCVAGLFRDDTDITAAQERLLTDTELLEERCERTHCRTRRCQS